MTALLHIEAFELNKFQERESAQLLTKLQGEATSMKFSDFTFSFPLDLLLKIL